MLFFYNIYILYFFEDIYLSKFAFNVILVMKSKKEELERIAEDATTDCYGEHEQIGGWCAFLQSEIDLPCKCFVDNKEALLIDFDTNKMSSAIFATIKIDTFKFRVDPETITIPDKKYSKYLEAYKYWM